MTGPEPCRIIDFQRWPLDGFLGRHPEMKSRADVLVMARILFRGRPDYEEVVRILEEELAEIENPYHNGYLTEKPREANREETHPGPCKIDFIWRYLLINALLHQR